MMAQHVLKRKGRLGREFEAEGTRKEGVKAGMSTTLSI